MFIKHERAFSAKNGKISCISVDSCYPFHQESLCFSHFISNSEECVRKYLCKKKVHSWLKNYEKDVTTKNLSGSISKAV